MNLYAFLSNRPTIDMELLGLGTWLWDVRIVPHYNSAPLPEEPHAGAWIEPPPVQLPIIVKDIPCPCQTKKIVRVELKYPIHVFFTMEIREANETFPRRRLENFYDHEMLHARNQIDALDAVKRDYELMMNKCVSATCRKAFNNYVPVLWEYLRRRLTYNDFVIDRASSETLTRYHNFEVNPWVVAVEHARRSWLQDCSSDLFE